MLQSVIRRASIPRNAICPCERANLCKMMTIQRNNIEDVGVLYLSKGNRKKLQQTTLGIRLMIKTVHMLGKCALNG
jgi:hypothetical protein